MSFPRYPSYKTSGVEWLGPVPLHWDVDRMGNLFREVAEPGNDKLPILSVSIHHGVSDKEVAEEDMDRKVTRSDDRSKYLRVAPGDLVYNMMRAWQGGFGTVMVEGMVSPAYVVARPRRPLKAAYIEALLRSPHAVEQMRRHSKGVTDFRLRLYWDEFKNIPVAFPPLAEQTDIIAFMDQETAKTDRLVAEQRRLMELLKEKRQAVISRAVTKGLNPNAPMRTSGIEWLGDVPTHWEIGRVKNYFRTCSGGTPNTSQQELYYTTEEDGIPWVRTTDLQNDVLRSVEVFITDRALADTACSILPPGTVMVAMYGGDGTIGKNGLLAIPAAINQAVCGLLPVTTHSPDYVFRFMQFYRPHWMIGAESSRIDPNISQERVRNAPFLKPPREEQAAIVSFLNNEIAKLDNLTAEAQRAIDLLQERRTALMSAAVTGQIDVRGFVETEAA